MKWEYCRIISLTTWGQREGVAGYEIIDTAKYLLKFIFGQGEENKEYGLLAFSKYEKVEEEGKIIVIEDLGHEIARLGEEGWEMFSNIVHFDEKIRGTEIVEVESYLFKRRTE